ncbi:MAG: hypothetical protein JO314_10580 [Acidobacteria bacterium]|nr:hypothetical protein [Acidobacteriota bacterium]
MAASSCSDALKTSAGAWLKTADALTGYRSGALYPQFQEISLVPVDGMVE